MLGIRIHTERCHIDVAIRPEHQTIRPMEMRRTTSILITGKDVDEAECPEALQVEAQNPAFNRRGSPGLPLRSSTTET